MEYASTNSSSGTKNNRNRQIHDTNNDLPVDPGSSQSLESPAPPDGGWGYFVVLASFLIHIITDGVTYSFGVFYLELLYYFEEGKGATAWIASILVGVTLCSGPIAGSLVNKYGCRSITIAGGILGSACLLASVWAQNIVTLYFTIGVGAGFGFGLIYLPAIVSVTCYFQKYRSLATGVAVCGSGLGTLIFAPCFKYLIAGYGWRGATMICSGVVLNCIVLGALFRPLEPSKPKKCTAKDCEKASSTNCPLIQQEQSDHEVTADKGKKYGNNSLDLEKDSGTGGIRTALSQPILISKVGSNHSETVRSFGSGGIMGRRDALYQGSMESIRNHSESYAWRHSEEMIALNNLRKDSMYVSNSKDVVEKTIASDKHNKDVLQEMLDFSIMKDPVFLLFTLSNFCTSIGFYIPYIYILPQAEEQGIDKNQASYLLAVLGVANTVGRIVLGYVSDKPWVNRLLVYNVCLTICGVSTLFSVFCTTFTAFMWYCIAYGFTAGAYVGLTSVILVDLLGLNRLTNAFGLLLLFQGLASFLGPPVAGWLYDALSTYDPGFYTAGAMIAASGLMLFAIPLIQRRVKRCKILNAKITCTA